MAKIVSTRNQALVNIERFSDELFGSEDLQQRLSYARAWYAHADGNGAWRFGPSKFIGYQGLSAKEYIARSQNIDGRRTEAQLEKWFTVVNPTSPLFEELNDQLFAFISQFDKAPSTAIRINVLNELCEDEDEKPNGDLIELLVAVARKLPDADLSILRKRLAS